MTENNADFVAIDASTLIQYLQSVEDVSPTSVRNRYRFSDTEIRHWTHVRLSLA